MALETPTLMNENEEIKEFCIDLDLNAEPTTPADENENINPKQEYDVVDSVMIMIGDEDTDHLLFEIGDLELTHISLDDGVLEIRAVQRIHQDIRYFKEAVDSGRLLRRTIRGSFN